MKKNINLMQNPADFQYDQYSEEYLIQALANLGQRIGIKGDGIAYKSFSFNDILISDKIYEEDKYVGFIEYNKSDENDKIYGKFGVANKKNLSDSEIIDTTLDINNVLNFDSDLLFSIPISNIEKFSKNSLCINNEKELTFILIGKKLGTNDNEDNNAVLIYYKFNINTNKLICCYKLSYYYTATNGDKYYYLINVVNKGNSNSLLDKYKFTFTLFNSSDLTNSVYKQKFEELFNYHNYFNNGDFEFSILNKDYEDIDNLLKYYGDTAFLFNSAISIILNNKNDYYNSLIKVNSFDLVFDTNKNELLADTDNTSSKLSNILTQEYSEININEELYYINEDINNLYVNIFKFYNEKHYFESKKKLIKNILLKVYERSIDYKQTLGKRLYVPLDYEFHYICNSNNELNIYYSNNIYVAYLDLSKVNLTKFWTENHNLVFDYNALNKIKVYNFEINYNKYIDDVINNVTIKDIYTMPYINANNNWCINDNDTFIKAIGKNAGNPNIIVIYSNDKINDGDDLSNLTNKYSLLSSISNSEKILESTFKEVKFNVNPILFNNINSKSLYIRCSAWIPNIDVDNYEYFKDSIILNLSDLKCLENSEYQPLYKGSYILTLWNLNEDENGNMSFNYIKHVDSDNALALGSTVNMLNELSNSSIANLNSQDLILLKSIISNVAQETINAKYNNWLIIKNKQSEEYNVTAYKNDLNTILQYDDDINIKNNHVIHNHSDLRYISDINNISVTNSLYPRYKYETEKVTTNEEITVIKNILQPIAIRETKITVNGNVVTDSEALIERLENMTEESTEIISEEIVRETAKITATNNNYNEYIFNSNVPTIDYKEIFNRNFNLLNRLNIISVDNNGQLYNAYIGTSYDEINKNILHIGSNSLNINIGNNTLMNEVDKCKFKTHNTLSLDFDNIILNSKNVEIKKALKTTKAINGYSCNIFEINLIDSNYTIIQGNIDLLTELETNDLIITQLSNSLFARTQPTNAANTNHTIYYYILLNKIFNDEIDIDLNSFTDVIINTPEPDQDNNKYKHFYINHSNNKKYYFVGMDESQLISKENIIYSPDKIKIMYYISTITNSNNEQNNIINIFISFK